MNNPLLKLSQRLGYQFKDDSLVNLALSHRSVGKNNNERLEFLGDSILNFVVADDLYQKFPKADEGQLSRLRAKVVRGETLTKVSKHFELGEFLHLGTGELKSGGHRRDSILADVVEALIGAIYLESGLEVARERILCWFKPFIEALNLQDSLKDPKTRLQEYLQGKQKALPKYEVLSVTGKSHEQHFKVSCNISELSEGTLGEGCSRRLAEQSAAQKALKVMGLEN